MAKKEYNVDLDIKGKVSATTVPNSTGSIVTWNSSTKVFGLRTNAEIIADLNLSSSFVPYTGATANVNLGSRSITSTGGFIGNATTATTLATARTINGTSFNGSANITTANWGTARNITIGNTTKSVNGSGNVAWSLSEIGAASSTSLNEYIPYTGATQTVDFNTQKIIHKGIVSDAGSSTSPWLSQDKSLTNSNSVAYLIIDGFTANTHRQLYIEVESVAGNGEYKRLVKGFIVNFTNTNIIGSTGDSRYLEVTGYEHGVRYGIGEVEKHSDTALKIPLIWIASSALSTNKISVKAYTGSVSNLTFNIEYDATSTLTTENPYLYRNASEKWVNEQIDNISIPTNFITTDTNQTGLTGDKTTSGSWTFGGAINPLSGWINGQVTNYSAHSIRLGGAGRDYMDFFEYGALWNFYKSSSTENTLVASISSNKISSNGYQIYGRTNSDIVLAGGSHRPVSDFALVSSIPTVNNGQLTLSTGTGLSGSATFTANQSGSSTFSVGVASTHKLPTTAEWNALPTTDTITRLRGTTSGTYTSGDLTLLAGANTTITQSGANITIASTNTNTTYTAGTGLSLTGTVFGQAITTSGTGTFVTGITQTANGFQVNLGTPPNTVYSTDTLAILNTGTSTSGALQTAKNLNDWLNGKGFSTQTLSAGSGVSIVGSVISNSAPNIDQKLSISGMKITLDRSGGTVTVPSSNLVTSTSATGTTNVATTNTNTYLNIVEGGTTLGSSTQVTGAGAVTVSSDVTGKLTITGVDTTYNTFTKTASGLVPAPTGTTSTRFLREDGTWVAPTDSTYSAGTLALLQEGTNTTNRVWSSKILTDFTDGKYLQLSGGTITGDLGIGITPTAKLDVNGTVRFRNFSNTLLSTDSNGNLSNVTNLILESDVLRPSTASGISLGNSVTPFKNLHLVGSGYFTGNMLFGQDDTPTAMRTAIMWNGKIKANNHIEFLSDGAVLLDKLQQPFVYLGDNSIDIGHSNYNHAKIFNQYGQIGIYDDMLEIQHPVISVNASSGYNVSVDDGKLRWYQNSSGQLVHSVIELHGNSLYTTSNANLGSSSNRWGKLWGTNVDFNGNMVVGKINNIKLNGRGSLGSPIDIITGNNLSTYVLGDNNHKNGIGTFRFESVITTNNEPVFVQYGASLLVQSNDTMFTLSANPFGPEIYVSGGTSDKNVRWNKKLAFSDNNFTITATAFYESSLRKFKTNINEFKDSGLELINSLDIVTFDRIDDKTKNKIGVIADDTSEEFLSEDKDAVDLYKTIFIQAKAIQELNQKNKTLEERINQLERIINEFL